MIIRQAISKEYQICAKLCMEYLETVCIPRLNLVISDLLEHIEQPNAFCFIAETSVTVDSQTPREIVAVFYGHLDHNVLTGDRFVTERLCYIKESFRKPVVLETLLTKMDEWAKEHGCVFARLKALGSSNNEALARLMVSHYGYSNAGIVLEKTY